jgi:hypothetical protein
MWMGSRNSSVMIRDILRGNEQSTPFTPTRRVPSGAMEIPPLLRGGALETGFLFGFGFFLAGVIVVGLAGLAVAAFVFHTIGPTAP